MSDLMDQAVITMPYDLAMGDDLSRMQFWSRVQLVYKEKCARIEADEALMRQALQALEGVERDFDGCYADHELKPVRAAITALRARLETSNV